VGWFEEDYVWPLKERESGYIEGYAAALHDLYVKLGGESMCSKSYDPMHVTDQMHSYAFDMKDGGRHHDFSDYDDLHEVRRTLLSEVLEWIEGDKP